MQDSVKLLIRFPQNTNIEEMATQLRSDYTFPQEIKILSRTKLSCSFETMADLLEIDFINTFGATSTKLINSRTFSQQMNICNQNFNNSYTDDESSSQSSLGEFPRDIFFAEEVNIKPAVLRKISTLTSLQDEIEQEQKLRELLTLYISGDEQFFVRKSPTIEEKDKNLQDQSITHTSLESQKEIPLKNEQSIWKPLLGGLALTSVIVGGFKLLRMAIG